MGLTCSCLDSIYKTSTLVFLFIDISKKSLKTVMLKHYIVVVNECSRDYAYNNQICDYAYESRIRDSCDNMQKK